MVFYGLQKPILWFFIVFKNPFLWSSKKFYVFCLLPKYRVLTLITILYSVCIKVNKKENYFYLNAGFVCLFVCFRYYTPLEKDATIISRSLIFSVQCENASRMNVDLFSAVIADVIETVIFWQFLLQL